MSRTKHHRNQKNAHRGEDWGAKYKVNRQYGGGTGNHPKQMAREERRIAAKIASTGYDNIKSATRGLDDEN